jgi:hypothetical protein
MCLFHRFLPHISLCGLSFHNYRQFGRWGRTVNWRLSSTCRYNWRKQFFFFYGERSEGKNGFWLKMVLSTQKMEISSIYCSSTPPSSSTSSTPCSFVYRFCDYSLTVPSHHVLVPFNHGLPQNEVVMSTNNFFHSWLCKFAPVFTVYLQKWLFDKDLITTLYHTSRS